MSEEITRGELSLHAPELVPENIHRVKRIGADDSRNAREQFQDAQEEQKDNETSERGEEGKSSPEKRATSIRNWEAIHDDIVLSETAQRLMDQSLPVESPESNPGKAEEKPPAPVPRIHLTA